MRKCYCCVSRATRPYCVPAATAKRPTGGCPLCFGIDDTNNVPYIHDGKADGAESILLEAVQALTLNLPRWL